MKLWNQAPFVRILFPFVSGILLAIYLETDLPFYKPVLLVVLLVFLFLPQVSGIQFTYRFRWMNGFFINVILLLLGYQLTLMKTETRNINHFSKSIDSSTNVICLKIIKPYVEKDKSFKVLAEITAVKGSQKWIKTIGKALIYFQKDSVSEKLNYGDCLLVRTKFNDIKSSGNPSEFNYKRYLSFQNIYQQAYVAKGAWKLFQQNKGNLLLKYSISLRDELLFLLNKNNIKNDEFAVGSALLIGYEDKLDADLINSYARCGAMHILSVSGLHVAIVYLVFNTLLFFLDKLKYGNIIKAIILIVLLWFYAALTGLSPSVLRAAAMLTFVAIAKSFNRYTNIYNTLAASAFILLLFNPFLIMNVGFLLSYVAVIGIVFIHPKLYELWEPDNWLIDKVWIIVSVSIAAQIATFPMGLYYFHQFPNYFLLSNLIVIPVLTLIIYLGIAFFIFSSVAPLAAILAKILSFTIFILNESVKFIEHLPFAVLQNISINLFENAIIYLLIFALMAFFSLYKIKYLHAALFLIIALLFMQLFEGYSEHQQKKIIVYNIPKTSAYDFIDGQQNFLLADSSFINNKTKVISYFNGNWCHLGIGESAIISNSKTLDRKENNLRLKEKFIQYYSTRIAIIDSAFKNIEGKFIFDYFIITKDAKLEIAENFIQHHPKKIIIDSSTPSWKVEKWKSKCRQLKIDYYSVADSGAFIVEL